jgi:hypothetical protein
MWSGWGILVVVFGFTGLIGAAVLQVSLEDVLNLPPTDPSVTLSAALILASLQIHLFMRWHDGREPRLYTDEHARREIWAQPAAGDFFFIPVRAWSWIALFLAVFLAGALTFEDITGIDVLQSGENAAP